MCVLCVLRPCVKVSGQPGKLVLSVFYSVWSYVGSSGLSSHALGFLEVLLTGQALHTRDKPPTLTPRVNNVPITLCGAPVALSLVPGRHWMMPLLPPLGPEGWIWRPCTSSKPLELLLQPWFTVTRLWLLKPWSTALSHYSRALLLNRSALPTFPS